MPLLLHLCHFHSSSSLFPSLIFSLTTLLFPPYGSFFRCQPSFSSMHIRYHHHCFLSLSLSILFIKIWASCARLFKALALQISTWKKKQIVAESWTTPWSCCLNFQLFSIDFTKWVFSKFLNLLCTRLQRVF